MPEGDTIFRSARRLHRALAGTTILRAVDNGRFVSGEPLGGAEVDSVAARGKHLLVHLQDGRVLHSHLGMTGAWHTYAPEQPWRKPRHRAALALEVRGIDPPHARRLVVCFTPKTLELLSPAAYRRHHLLNRLGPDLLQAGWSAEEVLGRFRARQHLPLGVALLHQGITAGVGNVIKSEALFLTHLDPFATVARIPDDQLLSLVDTSSRLLRANLVEAPRKTRFSSDGSRLWVYGRQSLPCLRCGEAIRMRRQGDHGRSTYWCPNCQRRWDAAAERGPEPSLRR